MSVGESIRSWLCAVVGGRQKLLVLGGGLVASLLMLAILVARSRGVTSAGQTQNLRLLDAQEYRAAAAAGMAATPDAQTLVIYQDDTMGTMGSTCITEVLDEMRVAYDLVKVDDFGPSVLEGHTRAVLCVTDMRRMGTSVTDLMHWIERGNSLLFLYAPSINGMFQMIQADVGITQVGDESATVEGLHFRTDLMPGCTQRDFPISDPFDSAISVSLDESCEVLVESTGERATPILWRRPLGEGEIVFDNLNILDRAYRGFHCAAYTLLGEGCVWPVINGAAFYLDDFPAPVPEGDSTFVSRDYGMSVDDFLTRHWWRDVSSLSERYGIRYTGVVIEQYSAQVQGPFARNQTTGRFRYFGGMLLRSGGEIGFHGYNHMPLVLRDFDFQNQYASYVQWEGYDDMRQSLVELDGFCRALYPGEQFRVYVPPSNVISEDGIRLLAQEFPEVRAIASVYITEEGGVEYGQEFAVTDDGIVQTPRIISGYLLEDFSRLTALCELTMHGASSHFQHPDDTLDEDRGAALGWERLFGNFEDYVAWLSEALPQVRMLTGSEFAAAVQRWRAVSVRQEWDEDALRLSLAGFVDEAWFYLRLNDATPTGVEGGSLTEVGDGLYLVEATRPELTVRLERLGGEAS